MPGRAPVDVLIATYNRAESLIMTLAGVAAQTERALRVVVADQSDEPVGDRQTILTLRRVIAARGGCVEWHTRPQIHGIAEQRDFLLARGCTRAQGYYYWAAMPAQSLESLIGGDARDGILA